MMPVKSQSGFVHLAIDLMPHYMKHLLPTEQKRIWAGVRRFADDLKEQGIHTLWISYGGAFQIYGSELTQNPDNLCLLTRLMGLQECKPLPGEVIVMKNDVDVFCNDWMRTFIKQVYPRAHTLLLSGGYASECVAYTAFSGLRLGYHCVGVTDLLFEEKQPASPPLTYHRKLLRNALLRQFREDGHQAAHFRPILNRLDYVDRCGVLQRIDELAVRPMQRAQRQSSEQKIGVTQR